jgi:hypothetical protein
LAAERHEGEVCGILRVNQIRRCTSRTPGFIKLGAEAVGIFMLHQLRAEIIILPVRIRLIIAIAHRHAGGRSPSQYLAVYGKDGGTLSEEVSDRLEAGECLRDRLSMFLN